jgi:hypothetical protein
MKGIVLNLLERTIVEEHGEALWDEMIERSGAPGAYTTLGDYPAEELAVLAAAAGERLGLDPDEVVRRFGRSAIPYFHESYPELFAPHRELIPFLLTLNEIIHPEVRKLYPDALVPVFSYDRSDEHRLLMGYVSPRRLCSLGEGLIAGAADHYEQRVNVGHPVCLKRGDERCVFDVEVVA